MCTFTRLLCFLFLISFTLSGCNRPRGCTNPNAENYDSDAERDNGSCMLRYLDQLCVVDFPALDPSGNNWDIGTLPDLEFRLAPLSDQPDWTYRSPVALNELSPITLIILDDIEFTNERWNFELVDVDDFDADDVIAFGQFHPLEDGMDGIIDGSNLSIELFIEYTVREN